MGGSVFLGQFEQMVMLTLLQLGDDAHAINIRSYLEEQAGHRVTRGALYRTLDRLEDKGHVAWEADEPAPERGGFPKRRFSVTKQGLKALRASHGALHTLSSGLEAELRGP
jgi:DNA-binding PadR family transcriptional regulator